MTSWPVVMGLDLSIAATGWQVAGRGGVLPLLARLGDSRLVSIEDHVVEQIRILGGVDLVVIEDLPTHAHGAGITGMVHGAVRPRLIRMGIPYALVTPATLKKYATGRGNAPKPDLRMELYKRAGLDLADDNHVDAWWLWHAGMEHLGHPTFQLPSAQSTALAKVTWPELEQAA
jgi:hypothetical protein